MTEWAKELRRLRIQNGLSQRALAEQAKIPLESVVAYERSGSLGLPNVDFAAHVLASISTPGKLRDLILERIRGANELLGLTKAQIPVAKFLALRDQVADSVKFNYSEPHTLREAFSTEELDPQRNVVGLGVGRVGTDLVQNRPSLRVYVVRRTIQVTRQLFSLAAELSKRMEVDLSLHDVDVIQVGRPQAYHHEQKSYSPNIPGGVTVVNLGPPVSPGTLGGWVLDSAGPPNVYMLGCWHVLAGAMSPARTLEVCHPSGPNPIPIAKLGAVLAPDFAAAHVNWADAALASPNEEVHPDHFLLRLGNVTGTSLPTANWTGVRKSGGMTHVTDGKIVDFFARVKIEYHGNRIAQFRGWGIEPTGGASSFSEPGDSGALVLDAENSAVAMVVGGDQLGTAPRVTFATPFETIVDEFFNRHNLNLTLRAYA